MQVKRLDLDSAFFLLIDFQERLYPAMAEKESLLARTSVFLQGASLLGLKGLGTEQYPKGLGATLDSLTSLTELSFLSKTSFSCLGNASIKEAILASQAKKIIVLGIETHVCVLQTSLDLLEMGYELTVLEDCVSSRSVREKASALARLARVGANVASAESVLFELCGSAENPKFRELSRIVKEGGVW